MSNLPTRVDVPAATAIKIVSDIILGYLKQGVPVRTAISNALKEVGLTLPEERFEWLCNFYQTEIDRLKAAQDDGHHVAGGQVIEVKHNDDYVEMAGGPHPEEMLKKR